MSAENLIEPDIQAGEFESGGAQCDDMTQAMTQDAMRQPKRKRLPLPDNPSRPFVRGFEWRSDGLHQAGESEKVTPAGDVLEAAKPAQWLAPPFELRGLVRDRNSDGWRLLIAWHDLDRKPHEEALPFELICGDGVELAKTLGRGGLVVTPEAPRRKALVKYLCGAHRKVKARVRLVEAMGWYGGAFILPSGEVIGSADGEPVRYDGEPNRQGSGTGGTLEGWQAGIARYAVGNSRLAFALSCAFAGPLMELIRPDGGGGFNLQGASSRGKSTCLEAAASVWGRPDPLPTWRATGNGLEGIAATRNDGFLVLDELSQVDPKEAGQIAYMLANGSAKARATREGAARSMRQWRLIFLSSGEQTLEDKVNEDGRKMRAGQEVRVPDIPSPAEGLIQDAHDMPSPGALSEHLKAQARTHYGHAARAFLVKLSEGWPRREKLRVELQGMMRTWLASALVGPADAQVKRVAGRFALVAVAGELAQNMGILPWPKGEAEQAALECFRAWLDHRGFSGASETQKGIQAVIAFLEKHEQSRFDIWGEGDTRVINRAGTKKKAEACEGWDYFITCEAWREICEGLSQKSVSRACIDAGILEPDSKGNGSQSIRLQGRGRVRVYVIRAAGLGQYQEREAA